MSHRALVATGTAGLGALAYATLVEPRWYRLRHVAVPGALRRPGSRLRILHVSDVHLVPGQHHRVRFLASLADLDHDLVVATGDLLGAPRAEDTAVEALAPLTRGRPGLVVLGSNDRFGPVAKSPVAYITQPDRRVHGIVLDTPRLVAGLADAGYRTLRAESVVVDTPAGPVVASGMDDPHLDPGVIPPVGALRPPPGDRPAAGDPLCHLGLVHAPYTAALDRLLEAGCEVLLSGHTHGGQLRVPGVGALVTNCDLPRAQARGLSRHRGGWLHVSPGLGHSRYAPVRVACRPEATLLELTG